MRTIWIRHGMAGGGQGYKIGEGIQRRIISTLYQQVNYIFLEREPSTDTASAALWTRLQLVLQNIMFCIRVRCMFPKFSNIRSNASYFLVQETVAATCCACVVHCWDSLHLRSQTLWWVRQLLYSCNYILAINILKSVNVSCLTIIHLYNFSMNVSFFSCILRHHWI